MLNPIWARRVLVLLIGLGLWWLVPGASSTVVWIARGLVIHLLAKWMFPDEQAAGTC